MGVQYVLIDAKEIGGGGATGGKAAAGRASSETGKTGNGLDIE
jgi:hypothetical protein